MIGCNTILSWLDDRIKKRALLHVKHQQLIEEDPWDSDEEEEELKNREEVLWSLLSNSIFLTGALMSSTVALYSVWEGYDLDEEEEEHEIMDESWIYKFLYVGGPFLYFINGLIWNHFSFIKVGVVEGTRKSYGDYSLLSKNNDQGMLGYVNDDCFSSGGPYSSSSFSNDPLLIDFNCLQKGKMFIPANARNKTSYRKIGNGKASLLLRSGNSEKPNRDMKKRARKIEHRKYICSVFSIKLSVPLLYMIAAAFETLECLLDCFITVGNDNTVQSNDVFSNMNITNYQSGSYNITENFVGDKVVKETPKNKAFFAVIISFLQLLSNHGYLLVSILELDLIKYGKFYLTGISRFHSLNWRVPHFDNIGDNLLLIGDALFSVGYLLDVIVCDIRLEDNMNVAAISPLFWATDATFYIWYDLREFFYFE